MCYSNMLEGRVMQTAYLGTSNHNMVGIFAHMEPFKGRPASFPGLTRRGDLDCVVSGQDMS